MSVKTIYVTCLTCPTNKVGAKKGEKICLECTKVRQGDPVVKRPDTI